MKEKGLYEPSDYFQIGVVVKSIEETVKHLQEIIGISGPIEYRDVNYTNATYYGETAGYRGKRAFFNVGPVAFELIELVDGKTIHEDFLKEKGEGLHHLGFEVKNLKESIKDAEKRGLKVTQSFFREDGSGFAYVDSDKVGGIIFELIHRPKKS
jgi:methylmalonyl-CoA/ethylmalonyl-CoA epimerase